MWQRYWREALFITSVRKHDMPDEHDVSITLRTAIAAISVLISFAVYLGYLQTSLEVTKNDVRHITQTINRVEQKLDAVIESR